MFTLVSHDQFPLQTRDLSTSMEIHWSVPSTFLVPTVSLTVRFKSSPPRRASSPEAVGRFPNTQVEMG